MKGWMNEPNGWMKRINEGKNERKKERKTDRQTERKKERKEEDGKLLYLKLGIAFSVW